MTAPVYRQAWVAHRSVSHPAPVLALVFFVSLCVAPVAVVGGAAALAADCREPADRSANGGELPLCVVPFGVGMWTAHYGFHSDDFSPWFPSRRAAIISWAGLCLRALLAVDGNAARLGVPDSAGLHPAGRDGISCPGVPDFRPRLPGASSAADRALGDRDRRAHIGRLLDPVPANGNERDRLPRMRSHHGGLYRPTEYHASRVTIASSPRRQWSRRR